MNAEQLAQALRECSDDIAGELVRIIATTTPPPSSPVADTDIQISTVPDEPLFTVSMYGTAAAADKAREEWLAAKGEPQARQCDWTDAEVAEFLSVAMRHVQIYGELECIEIRQGIDAVMRARSLAQAEQQS